MSAVLQIKRLSHGEGLSLPTYETAGAAGFDLLAAIDEDVAIDPRKRALIPTGISIALPEGHEGQVRPRSGLAVKHGLTVLNAPGTIDEDYRGEIHVPLINLGEQSFTVTRGMRIAQMVIAPVVQVAFEESETLPPTKRGDGGFGSTGL